MPTKKPLWNAGAESGIVVGWRTGLEMRGLPGTIHPRRKVQVSNAGSRSKLKETNKRPRLVRN
jgi:hypothetical protein